MEQNTTTHTIANFLQTVSDDVFVNATQDLLRDVNDPFILSECAELAIERQFGGAFFRAVLWSKVFKACGADEEAFKQVCKEVGIGFKNAMKLVEAGNVVSLLKEQGQNTALLHRAPNQVVANALRQNSRVSDYFIHSISVLESDTSISHTKIHNLWCKQHGSVKANLDIIKPSDWWAFGRPKWERDPDFPGSIPGEVYANALYYFAPQTGLAVDPMAGSGMLKRVYEDRGRWQRDRDFDLDIEYFDLHPQRDFIKQHDATHPLPTEADWIFLDPPYFGQSDHLFKGDLASTLEYDVYLDILAKVIEAMAASLNPNGTMCIFLPKWSGHNQSDINRNVPQDALRIAENCGLSWIDFAVVSRGRQQESNGARLNERAKTIRRLHSDTCILNVLRKE